MNHRAFFIGTLVTAMVVATLAVMPTYAQRQKTATGPDPYMSVDLPAGSDVGGRDSLH